MSYELSPKILPNFLRYVNKVYGFSQTVSAMQGNDNSQVSPQTIFMSVFLSLLLLQGSLRQLAKDVKAGRIRKFLLRVDKKTYCANTLWGVENNAIKDLKDNWYMSHNFHHHPNATLAFARASSLRCC